MIVLKHLKYSDYLSRLKMRNVKMNISLLPENQKKSLKVIRTVENFLYKCIMPELYELN